MVLNPPKKTLEKDLQLAEVASSNVFFSPVCGRNNTLQLFFLVGFEIQIMTECITAIFVKIDIEPFMYDHPLIPPNNSS